MSLRPVNLNEMPKTAQAGIAFWLLSWVCLLADFYVLTEDTGWIGKLAIAVGLLTFFLVTAQNWARMIGLMASAMAMLFCAILVYAMRGHLSLFLLSAASLILFGITVFFLLNKKTASFYKAHSKQETKEDSNQTR